jgi:hypothetical protein
LFITRPGLGRCIHAETAITASGVHCGLAKEDHWHACNDLEKTRRIRELTNGIQYRCHDVQIECEYISLKRARSILIETYPVCSPLRQSPTGCKGKAWLVSTSYSTRAGKVLKKSVHCTFNEPSLAGTTARLLSCQ